MKIRYLFAAILMYAAPLPASVIVYATTLIGLNEVPPTGSSATGVAIVTLNGDTLSVNESFTGLVVSAAAAHIHCCALPGVNAIVAVPFNNFPSATSGSYSNSFDLTQATTYNVAFVTANGGTAASAEAALIAGLNSGQAYANIHDATFPGGEIRGQLQAVPEPATWTLSGWALAGVLLVGLRRRISAGQGQPV